MKKLNQYYCYLLLFIPLFYSFTLSFKTECDIWFLFSHGRYVLENGFPHMDFLSMHQGMSFVMQQWLSSVIFYLAYHFLHSIGVYFVVWICNAIIIYLLYLLCMKISKNLFISCMISLIISLLLEICFITSRPFIFTIMIFLLLLYIMESYREKKGKQIYFLIGLSILQVNLHASMWPILFVLLLPYFVSYFFLFFRDKDKTIFLLILIIIMMVLVGFLNPYGIEAMTYSLHSYGVSDINHLIWEMNGLDFSSDFLYVKFFCYLVFFIMIGVSFVFFQSKKKVEIYQLLLFYGTYFMALCNIRNICIFLICSIPFCGEYLSSSFHYIKKRNWKLIFIIVLLFLGLCSCFVMNKDRYILSDEYNGQKEVLSYLNHHVSTKEDLYTSNTNGSYFGFYGYKVYIDTRAEVYLKSNNHKEDIFHEY